MLVMINSGSRKCTALVEGQKMQLLSLSFFERINCICINVTFTLLYSPEQSEQLANTNLFCN